MIKRIKGVILLLSLLALSIPASSQEDITFSHVGVAEGLSQNTVFDIAQDRDGFMWFATYNGLNKYNGYEFKIYRHQGNDSLSIASSIIRAVKTDTQGRVWVGTQKGLSLYELEKDAFHNYYRNEEENQSINHIVEIDEDRLLLNAPEGLLLFDVLRQRFVTEGLHPALFELKARVIYRYGDSVYIGTGDGLFVYSIGNQTLQCIYKHIPGLGRIQTLLQQSADKLWIGTEGHGLYLLNPQTSEVKYYRKGEKGLNADYIRSLAVDKENKLWVGAIEALYIYDEVNDEFKLYKNDPLNDNSLSHGSVRCIYKDIQGGMWLGTFFGGLNYYHPLKDRFKNIRQIPYRNSLSDNIIGCIVEDHNKNMWIGTNGGGLNYYRSDTRSYTHYTQKEGLLSSDVKAVYIGKDNKSVYIGTHAGGLNILHMLSNRLESYPLHSDIGVNESVYAIVPAKDEHLWLGTASGLILFNTVNKRSTLVTTGTDGKTLHVSCVRNLLSDSKGRLWVGYENGLRVYEQDGDGVRAISVINATSLLEHIYINSIYEAYNGTFWVSTRNGVYQINEKTQELKHYDTSHGLADNVVYGMLEDSFGRLWMSTDEGLSCLHPQTGVFRNYLTVDGLQSNQFTPFAYCRRENGELLFGGINGITTFQPEHLPENPYTPAVVLTHLELFNKTVSPNDETGILTKHISNTDHVSFTAEQSMFVISFVVSDYLSETRNLFAYKLEGYDKDWTYCKDPYRQASYSNLPAGDYRFLVKAANRDGRWNDAPTVLDITILPHWYETWWARLLFFALFMVVGIAAFRLLWMRKSMQAQLAFERIDKERQHEVSEMKMRFFINMSHELRTPLTLILAPVHEMLDRVGDKWVLQQVEHIKRNADRLMHIVNQLMDFRRAELGVFGLKVRKQNIYQLVEKLYLSYEQLARQKQITYNYHSEMGGSEVWCDANYIELIVNNLLSNAFKYTHSGQCITVSLKRMGNECAIQVQDTGIGIPEQEQHKIFERFYQVDSKHLSSGIGLSLVKRLAELHHGRVELESTEGIGSIFSVYLPVNEEAYKADERITNESTDTPVYSTNTSNSYLLEVENMANEEIAAKTDKTETVLLVEDNAEIRRYLGCELEAYFNVLSAENGEEALSVLKEQQVDLICTDVMMPKMNGITLCKQVKQSLRTCHIPVIILSAKSDVKDQMEGLQVGADDYIPKPFVVSVVVTKIRNILRTHYLSKEHYANSVEIEPEKIALNPMDEDLLKRAVAVVEKHMDDITFSTDTFAAEMNISRSNLHLKMRAVTGEGASEFIRKVRFGYACKLLKTGQYTVSEISVMAGYNTPAYFSTCFKKYVGCLPSEYAKSNK